MSDKHTMTDNVAVTWLVRSFYISASAVILLVRFMPGLKRRFLSYGARSTTDDKILIKNGIRKEYALLDPILDLMASMKVPHSWFYHFYIISVICCLYWQRHAPIDHLWGTIWSSNFRSIVSETGRARLAMLLMLMQSLRRLYECLFISKHSESTMWAGHYVIGILFYITTNIAIWIEVGENELTQFTDSYRPRSRWTQDKHIIFRPLIVFVASANFIYWSSRQYYVHKYLATRQQYQVPDHPIFVRTNTLCPHYGAEVYIYTSLMFLTAPRGSTINCTLLCALAFVAVNLGVTADLTKTWYLCTFPQRRAEIEVRYKMIKGIF